MQVMINSNNYVDVHQESIQQWQAEIAASLDRFSNWITRIEVHLTDENSDTKGGGDDIRCLMEARPASQQPVSIEVRTASVEQALQQGTSTLERRLANLLDKARTEQRKRK